MDDETLSAPRTAAIAFPDIFDVLTPAKHPERYSERKPTATRRLVPCQGLE